MASSSSPHNETPLILAVDRYGVRRVCVRSGSFGDNDFRMIGSKFIVGHGEVRGFQKEKERERRGMKHENYTTVRCV